MSDSTSITGTVRIAENSPQRVALDLARWINSYGADEQDRLIRLYARCVLAGTDPYNEVIKQAKTGRD